MHNSISKIIPNSLFFLMNLLLFHPAFASGLDKSLTPEKKKKKNTSGLGSAFSSSPGPDAFLPTLKMTNSRVCGLIWKPSGPLPRPPALAMPVMELGTVRPGLPAEPHSATVHSCISLWIYLPFPPMKKGLF